MNSFKFQICRFEDEKYVSGLFEELWEENTSGDIVTLQLYLEEIVSLATESLTSSSWASKRKVDYFRVFSYWTSYGFLA